MGMVGRCCVPRTTGKSCENFEQSPPRWKMLEQRMKEMEIEMTNHLATAHDVSPGVAAIGIPRQKMLGLRVTKMLILD